MFQGITNLREAWRQRRAKRIARWMARHGNQYAQQLLDANERLNVRVANLEAGERQLLDLLARESARVAYETAVYVRGEQEAKVGQVPLTNYNPWERDTRK